MSDILELLDQAWKVRGKGDYCKGKELLRKAEQICAPSDYDSQGRILHVYAQYARDQGNLEGALVLYMESNEFYVKAKNPDRIAHSLRHVAGVQAALKDYEEAEQNYNTVLKIYRELPEADRAWKHDQAVANALSGFGKVLESLGKTSEAILKFKEAHDLYFALGNQGGTEETCNRLRELESS